MLARKDELELDTLVAEAFDAALRQAGTDAQRTKLIRSFGRLNRRLSLHPVQERLLQALRGGGAHSLQDIADLVDIQFRRSLSWRRQLGERRGPVLLQKPMRGETLLSPGEVARELGVSAKTVTNWCKKGMLRYVELESGHRRIPQSALDAYRQSQARWNAFDEARARAGAPDLDEEQVLTELAKRRARSSS